MDKEYSTQYPTGVVVYRIRVGGCRYAVVAYAGAYWERPTKLGYGEFAETARVDTGGPFCTAYAVFRIGGRGSAPEPGAGGEVPVGTDGTRSATANAERTECGMSAGSDGAIAGADYNVACCDSHRLVSVYRNYAWQKFERYLEFSTAPHTYTAAAVVDDWRHRIYKVTTLDHESRVENLAIHAKLQLDSPLMEYVTADPDFKPTMDLYYRVAEADTTEWMQLRRECHIENSPTPIPSAGLSARYTGGYGGYSGGDRDRLAIVPSRPAIAQNDAWARHNRKRARRAQFGLAGYEA